MFLPSCKSSQNWLTWVGATDAFCFSFSGDAIHGFLARLTPARLTLFDFNLHDQLTSSERVFCLQLLRAFQE